MNEVQHIIASALDRPSLYMGGPSVGSLSRALEVIEMLNNFGFEIVKTGTALWESQ